MKVIPVSEEEKSILKVIIENAPQGESLSIAEVRKSIRLLDVLEQSGDTLSMEDADHAFLLQRFSSGRFVRADRALLKLFDKVEAVSTH